MNTLALNIVLTLCKLLQVLKAGLHVCGGNGSIVISTAFFVYITYCCTNFVQIVLTVTNAASEATGYRLSHSLEVRDGAQTFASDVQLASFDTSYRSQTNLRTL